MRSVCPSETDAQHGRRAARLRACARRSSRATRTITGSGDAVVDLEAVRRALGYATFDIYGTSYGGTVAQMYLKRFPRSVRTLVLDGATFTDVPFYARFAANGQRALSLVERECKAQPTCARAFPHWREELDTLIEQWNETPMKLASGSTLSGDDLSSIVQQMLLTADTAASIPLLVSRAAAGDVGPLVMARAASGGVSHSLMYWTIMCNEPWVGRDARGPWRTFLDGATSASLTQLRSVCPYIPGHAEPLSTWRRVHSNVPTLVLAGQADPQDPIGNLPGLATALPRSRVVIAPAQGHAVGQYGCLGALVGRFVSRGSAQHLDTRCARSLRPSVFFTR